MKLRQFVMTIWAVCLLMLMGLNASFKDFEPTDEQKNFSRGRLGVEIAKASTDCAKKYKKILKEENKGVRDAASKIENFSRNMKSNKSLEVISKYKDAMLVVNRFRDFAVEYCGRYNGGIIRYGYKLSSESIHDTAELTEYIVEVMDKVEED